MNAHRSGDIAALPLRLGALFVVRLVLAATVVAAATLVPGVIELSPALLLAAAYLVVTVALEVLRQAVRRLPRIVVDVAVLTDGIFLAAVVTLAGGPSSAPAFLLYVHLIAVTLLASYRTGLKVAVWQSVLLVVAYHLPPHVAAGARPDLTATVLAIVAFLGVAITTAACSALNERELRRSRSGFATLAEMAHAMQQAHSPQDVAELLLHSVTTVVPGARAALYVRAEQTVTVRARGSVEVAPAVDVRDGVLVDAWRQGSPQLVRRLDAVDNPLVAGALPDARNVVVVPLASEGEPTGAVVVEVGGPAGMRVRRSTVALLEQLGAHAALVHRNVRLLAEVRHLASVDPLTGLANRRTFTEALRREVARARRSGEALSLLLLDVDHFKRVNDEHGHPLGDEVLRHVGRVLRQRGREVDVAARYGGEEFAVLLPACPVDEAVRVAERLRAGIADANAPLPVTASVGVAVLEDATGGEALVTAADQALYEAKRTGRDRVVAAADALAGVQVGVYTPASSSTAPRG